MGSYLVAGDPTVILPNLPILLGDKFPLYSALYPPATRGSVWGDGEIIDLRRLPEFQSPQDADATAGAFQWHRPTQPRGPLPNTAGQGLVQPNFTEYRAPARGQPVVPLATSGPPGQLFLLRGDLPEVIIVPLSWNPVQQFVPMPNAHELRLFTDTREGLLFGSFRHPVTHRTVLFSGVYRPFTGAIGTFLGPEHVGEMSLTAFD